MGHAERVTTLPTAKEEGRKRIIRAGGRGETSQKTRRSVLQRKPGENKILLKRKGKGTKSGHHTKGKNICVKGQLARVLDHSRIH